MVPREYTAAPSRSRLLSALKRFILKVSGLPHGRRKKKKKEKDSVRLKKAAMTYRVRERDREREGGLHPVDILCEILPFLFLFLYFLIHILAFLLVPSWKDDRKMIVVLQLTVFVEVRMDKTNWSVTRKFPELYVEKDG